MVLERGLVFTTQTSVLPRQVPALKNDVCADTRFARFNPADGSLGSRASRGNVMTARSATRVQVNCDSHFNPESKQTYQKVRSIVGIHPTHPIEQRPSAQPLSQAHGSALGGQKSTHRRQCHTPLVDRHLIQPISSQPHPIKDNSTH